MPSRLSAPGTVPGTQQSRCSGRSRAPESGNNDYGCDDNEGSHCFRNTDLEPLPAQPFSWLLSRTPPPSSPGTQVLLSAISKRRKGRHERKVCQGWGPGKAPPLPASVSSAAPGPDTCSPFLPPGGCEGQTGQQTRCQVLTAARTYRVSSPGGEQEFLKSPFPCVL